MTFNKFEYMKTLWRVEFPSPHYYRVLVTLLDHAKRDGTDAYPGHEALAAECCCSVDTVKRALRWAKARGMVIETKRGRRNAGATVWSFPQRGQSAPLYRNLKGADRSISPGSQGGWGAPPTELEQYDGKKTPSIHGSKERNLDPWGSGTGAAGASRTDGSVVEVVQSKEGFPQKNNDSETPTVGRDVYSESLNLDSKSGTPPESSAPGALFNRLNRDEHQAYIDQCVMTADEPFSDGDCIEPESPEPADPWWESAPRLTDDELGQLDLEALMRDLETA